MHIKFYQVFWFSLNVSKSTDRMANSVDPDQTAPLGAVWSGPTLFAQPFLSDCLAHFFFFWENMKKIARFHQEN